MNSQNQSIDPAKILDIIGQISTETSGPARQEDHMIDDLAYDSVKMIVLAVTLEEEFGLDKISEADSAGILTAKDVIQLVNRLSQQAQYNIAF